MKKKKEGESLTAATPVTTDIFRSNEIEANLLMGKILLICTCIAVIMMIASFLHIPMPITSQTCFNAGIVLLVTVTPVWILIRIYKGDKSWLKLFAFIVLIIASIMSSAIIGGVAYTFLVMPMTLAARYYDKRFAIIITVVSVVAMAVSCFLNDRIFAGDGMFRLGPKLLITSVIGVCVISLTNSGRRLINQQADVSKQTARIETELNLATDIQMGMLPTVFPAFPDHSDLELFAKNTPAKEVGGDFYDYFRIDDDHVAIVIADVSGKGVGAALFMTISKILLKNEMQILRDPAAALTETNRQLCENNEAGMFVTGWAGIYEISSRTLSFANAGHNPPVLVKKGQSAEYLQMEKNFILALMPGIQYKGESIKLDVGDEILLYTDGVTEANDVDGAMYGEERLITCLNSLAGETAEAQIQKVNDDIVAFGRGAEQFDDITMLCLKIK